MISRGARTLAVAGAVALATALPGTAAIVRGATTPTSDRAAPTHRAPVRRVDRSVVVERSDTVVCEGGGLTVVVPALEREVCYPNGTAPAWVLRRIHRILRAISSFEGARTS